MDLGQRRQFQERFIERLLRRRPELSEHYAEQLGIGRIDAGRPVLEASAASPLLVETIVNNERPVLFVQGDAFNTADVAFLGLEARVLVDDLNAQVRNLSPVMRLIGRIDVANLSSIDYVGTGWFVAPDVVVTNRHVAGLIAEHDGRRFVFSHGIGGKPYEASLCNAHEFDDPPPIESQVFRITEVLYIEPNNGPHDIAFVQVARPAGGPRAFIPIAAANVADDEQVCVVGYPARASKDVIPDQDLMERLYRNRYDVKRAAPGYGMGTANDVSEHDCTTLGGNSGSVVLNFRGEAVGLHFAGRYQEANYAVPASVLREYVRGKRWNAPVVITTRTSAEPPPEEPAAAITQNVSNSGGRSVTVTIPLTITVSLGDPMATPAAEGGRDGDHAVDGANQLFDAAQVEQALAAYWDQRSDDVVAARVGFFDEGDEIGDRPFIAVSVAPRRLGAFQTTAATTFQGAAVRYFAATAEEQVESMPQLEAVDRVAYDDAARTGRRFSFDEVNDEMEALLHVGPEYSWDVLKKFLGKARGKIVAAMYEFHAKHIMEAVKERLDEGASFQLVLDNATFHRLRDPDEEFDRDAVFDEWADQYGDNFQYIVAPEGRNGLIANAYHIKVTVRHDHAFWLSSGNWKAGSSQPIIRQEDRDNASSRDLRGNREWHVVVKNKTLASRFRNHIRQDFERSETLREEEAVADVWEGLFVDVPAEPPFVEERRAPGRVLEPRAIDRRIKVRPLLTPDRQGAVYSDAVLDLIRSARRSLLFQIPYISMPPNPRAKRGFIDDMIKELTEKLKTLDDARVILRSGGSRFSSPTHAAWFFKSKGVDVRNRVKSLADHHTKGMIVDGRRTLLGSHNWSAPGVTLNRDASLMFDDEEIADYYTEAFEIDWARSNSIRPRRAETAPSFLVESVAHASPPGYKRISLAQWLKDD